MTFKKLICVKSISVKRLQTLSRRKVHEKAIFNQGFLASNLLKLVDVKQKLFDSINIRFHPDHYHLGFYLKSSKGKFIHGILYDLKENPLKILFFIS